MSTSVSSLGLYHLDNLFGCTILAISAPNLATAQSMAQSISTMIGEKILLVALGNVETPTIYSPGVQTAAPGAGGTLAAGSVDIALPNVAGDRLAVLRNVSAGTPGVLGIKSKDANTVTVQTWVAGTGLQTLDTSTVLAFNYGQTATTPVLPSVSRSAM